MRLLLMVWCFGVAAVGAVTAEDDVRLVAELDNGTYVSGEEMHLTVTFENDGEDRVPVLKVAYLTEDVLTVEIYDVATGQVVPEQVRSEVALGQGDPVLLEAGERLAMHFDLHFRYPLGLESGVYELEAGYTCSAERYPEKMLEVRDVEITADPVRFVVVARTGRQDDQFERYGSIVGAVSAESAIEQAGEALRVNPNGLFARRIRIELAAALWRAGQLDDAIEKYDQILGDSAASPATREFVNFVQGLLFHELGDIEAAIDVMGTVDTREARIYRTVWEKELDDTGQPG